MTATATTPEIRHAREAGLRYVDDGIPGITRKRVRSGFAFYDPTGKKITDADEIARIKALAIPPAYERVWISPIPNGHVQATARDARGRKQYRYHKRWREVRDATKFDTIVAFGRALPKLRERVAADLELACMSKDKVVATVVRMLDDTLIRVGNESYARDNDSYGLTTLRPRHVRIEAERRIRLTFRGKSGVEHAITIDDKRLARTIARCRDLPGALLFSYRGEDGETSPVQSEDVNAYLRETMGADFTAKDFRTFAGTVICATALAREPEAPTVGAAKTALKTALEGTAKRLGNTPTVCRKSYVHPAVIETYLDERALALPAARASAGLDRDERRVLRFLERLTKRDAAKERLRLLERSVERATSARGTRPKASR